MKERPILFSGPMVKAILDGRKTQTRRVLKHKYYLSGAPSRFNAYDCENGFGFESEDEFVRCPFGKPGDHLWVRETWTVDKCWDDYKPSDIPVGRSIEYWSTDIPFLLGKKRQSIFMPRWASRITLEIVNIWVERLQDISEGDAIDEGSQIPVSQLPKSCQQAVLTERCQFSRIWDSINAKKHPWSSNPWVWVVEFKKLEE